MEQEESQVSEAISSKFSSHVTYLKMNNNISNQDNIEGAAAGYRHSDKLFIPSDSTSLSQILFNQPKSNSNYAAGNPFKPPVYQS